MVASNKTDQSLGTVDIAHEGPEEYNNIWQKVRSMWSYVYDNYYEKYDWYDLRSSILVWLRLCSFAHLFLLRKGFTSGATICTC